MESTLIPHSDNNDDDEAAVTFNEHFNMISKRKTYSLEEIFDSLMYFALSQKYGGFLHKDFEQYTAIFNSSDELKQHLGQDYSEGDCARFLERLKSLKNTRQVESVDVLMAKAAIEATQASWLGDYRGEAAKALETTIKLAMNNKKAYVRMKAIVQSSGTGKSRLVDELSKSVLVLPMNLRDEGATGYPAPDKELSTFFREPLSQTAAIIRFSSFLMALFKTVEIYLPKLGELAKDQHTLALQFRHIMSAGQGFYQQGQLRRQFYENVIQEAKQIELTDGETLSKSPNLETKTRSPLDDVANRLTTRLQTEYPNYTGTIVLAFDEAHTLTTPRASHEWTYFFALRRALRVIKNCDVFSLCLSTAGKIASSTPPTRVDPSARIRYGTLPVLTPYCALGLDLFCKGAISENSLLMTDVVEVSWMCSFGRPLFASRYKDGGDDIKKEIVEFAASKLLCSTSTDMPSSEGVFAVLSSRLALTLKAASPAGSTFEQRQVEKHMRLCIKVHEGFEAATTVSASEPILSAAAEMMMKKYRDRFTDELKPLFQDSSLDKGNRGELIAMYLLTRAHDDATPHLTSATSLLDFVDRLVPKDFHEQICNSGPSNSNTQNPTSFQTTFADSQINFNHFIKIQNANLINVKYLWVYLARRAAILCADGQTGIDIVIPFLVKKNSKLGPKTVSAILIQVKNDFRYKAKPHHLLFHGINPFQLNLFNRQDKDNVPPIVRMVFALGSSTSAVVAVEDRVKASIARRAKSKSQTNRKFTSFDIWFAKASSKTFGVIPEGHDSLYQELLESYRAFPAAYQRADEFEDESEVPLKQAMYPLADVALEHWTCVAKQPETNGAEDIELVDDDDDDDA